MPARQVDVAVEPRLVGRLIADVAGQPNALPLFQYALTELFDERSGARARPRDLRADRRRAQGRRRAVPSRSTRASVGPSRRPCASCSSGSPPCRETPSAADGSRRRSSRRSTSTSWRCRRRSTPSLAIACSPSIATRRPAPRRSRSPTRPCSSSGTGSATGSTRAADDLTTHAALRRGAQRVGGGRARARLPPQPAAGSTTTSDGPSTTELKLTHDGADVPRAIGRRTGGRQGRGTASGRRDAKRLPTAHPVAARGAVRGRRGARRDHRLPAPHG